MNGSYPALLMLSILSLPVVPNVRLTDRGLVDVNAQTLID